MYAIVTTDGTPVSFGAGIAASEYARTRSAETIKAVVGSGRHVKEVVVLWDEANLTTYRAMWKDFTGPMRAAHVAYQPLHRDNTDRLTAPLR